MPHFIIDCSDNILKEHSETEINQQVHQVANQTELFEEADIKVRVNPYQTYLVGGNSSGSFIHVFAHIMQGRTTEQKAALSKAVVGKLAEMFPTLSNIAMNVSDFEKATYCNRKTL